MQNWEARDEAGIGGVMPSPLGTAMSLSRPLRRVLYRQNSLSCQSAWQHRVFSINSCRRQQFGPFGTTPGLDDPTEERDDVGQDRKRGRSSSESRMGSTLYKMFESAATTFASIAILGLAGYSYHKYYKSLVLRKMENSFKPGDPVLDLASGTHSPGGFGSMTPESSDFAGVAVDDSTEHWIPRDEQKKIDQILSGHHGGHYYLLIGEKGTGKSSMLIEAMRKVDGEGISMFEAHADLEIFRIRLGKALDFEFHEDYIGSLFSIRGPRDTTALLDIERAFNKLEKIALNRKQKHLKAGNKPRPLVLVVNGTHMIRDDDDGHDLLEMLQQRAEAWAASNLVTMVFNSDDYWIYERFKRYSTRMEVLPVLDLPKDRAITALTQYRSKYHPKSPVSRQVMEKVYDKVGGRLTFLSRVAKSKDMLETCDRICEAESTWFLNRCWILGEEMDDDVMDQQKYASAAMVLAKALVEKEKEMLDGGLSSADDEQASSSDPSESFDGIGHSALGIYDPSRGHILPEIPLHQARQIMTRADFVQSYDHDNIFTIDSNAMVRADSVPMMNAFRKICSQPGFSEHLDATLDRISAIESLNRTRELTLKDLWTIQTGEQRGHYAIAYKDGKGRTLSSTEFSVAPNPAEEEKSD